MHVAFMIYIFHILTRVFPIFSARVMMEHEIRLNAALKNHVE